MSRGERALPWLLPLVALLSNLRAAIPDLTYYYRDFLFTFYPLQVFQAGELSQGRWPVWNPYLHEGTFAFPTLYPADLLLALRATPELASWLLTLHLPLAALAAYALARELELPRPAAFMSGACYALGGFSLSCLNLHWFLQALALAPLIVLGLRRAARLGGRAVPLAALALAAGLTTLAVEFVAQSVLLGTALALLAGRDWRAVGRIAAAGCLGLTLAALPVALIVGILPETQRGAGFDAGVGLANSLHPLALLQVIVAGLFGPLDSTPGESFWGARLSGQALPYFLSLYLGPVVALLAAAGVAVVERQRRLLLLGCGAAALLVSLGEWGGVAPTLLGLPGLRALRYPSKAFMTVHLVAALFAGAGVAALRAPRWPRAVSLGGASLCATLALAAAIAWLDPPLVGRVFAPSLPDPTPLARAVGAELALAAAIAGLAGAMGLLVARGRLGSGLAATLVVALGVLDLARAGAGLNPQVEPRALEQAEEIRSLRLDRLEGGRVFSYDIEQSPALHAFLASGARHRLFAVSVMYRRLLVPYTNLIDAVESGWGKDLLSFGSAPELQPEEYEPGRLASILPRLREAAVTRILSLDPLEHPQLRLLAEAPAGRPGLRVRAYELRDSLPRAFVACRSFATPGPAHAFALALRPDFDGASQVALEAAVPADCSRGAVRRQGFVPGLEEYQVEADGAGLLVTRDSFAMGWTASVDGASAPVLRANGKYRAVPVGRGRHQVVLRYRAPGLAWGATLSGLGALGVLLLLLRSPRSRPLG